MSRQERQRHRTEARLARAEGDWSGIQPLGRHWKRARPVYWAGLKAHPMMLFRQQGRRMLCVTANEWTFWMPGTVWEWMVHGPVPDGGVREYVCGTARSAAEAMQFAAEWKP